MFVIVFIVYVFMAIYEFVPLYKEKKWMDFAVNAVLWTLSLTIAMLLCFNVQIPSPQGLIEKLTK